MIDREKVIKALEFCTDPRIVNTCYGECPYAVADDEYKCDEMKRDALELLKEQEEQIKNRDESLEKAREEIKWLRGMLKEREMIVRCEKCIYGDDFDCPAPLPKGYICQKGHGPHTGDWFCADGKGGEVDEER